ncbi:hypothetical protein PHMEG_00010528 [Phytophthora megakarya]|uniref:Uncharacterized protein n=1 Tax=Phytophthora megakarya TaxID=4795 RepID=A0A225WFH2_9STRA|nr:hypothetical protein PHMEG_00010528 [Phytophthora megakarya]
MSIIPVEKANTRENQAQKEHGYHPDDLVMVAQNEQRSPKLQTLYDWPCRVISVRSDGTVMIEKTKYQVTIPIRRVKPFQSTIIGEDVVPS